MKTLTFRPSAPSPVRIRQETRAALDAFFRAFGFTEEADLSDLATWAIASASVLGMDLEPQAATALARDRVEAWLERVLGAELTTGGALLARGRAAFVLCEGARWGARAMTAEAAPLDFSRALRDALPRPAPAAVPAVMPEQHLVLWPFAEMLRRWWRAEQPDVSISR